MQCLLRMGNLSRLWVLIKWKWLLSVSSWCVILKKKKGSVLKILNIGTYVWAQSWCWNKNELIKSVGVMTSSHMEWGVRSFRCTSISHNGQCPTYHSYSEPTNLQRSSESRPIAYHVTIFNTAFHCNHVLRSFTERRDVKYQTRNNVAYLKTKL
jgi:hypothetical protein